MKALIINNLASGYRDGSIYDFVRSFTEDGDEVCMRSTDGTTSIDGLLDDASDFDVVVASGGDGTVTSVAYALTEYWCAAFALPCWHGEPAFPQLGSAERAARVGKARSTLRDA